MSRVLEDMRLYMYFLNDMFPGQDSLTPDQVCKYLGGIDWYVLIKDKNFKYKQPGGKGYRITIPKLMFSRYLAA